jgi:hypothetical protein
VYPSQSEMKEATEEFLFDNHEDYVSQFNKETWTITYEQHFYKNVSFNYFCIIIKFLKLINNSIF